MGVRPSRDLVQPFWRPLWPASRQVIAPISPPTERANDGTTTTLSLPRGSATSRCLRTALEREHTAAARLQSAHERDATAAARDLASLVRDRDRDAAATDREQAARDRQQALADREALARALAYTEIDPLTGHAPERPA